MKRLVLILLGMAFLIGASAFAINPPEPAPGRAPAPKAQATKPGTTKTVPRETRMRATGIVKELTGDKLIIERTVTAEAMEFHLDKPLDKIRAGDKVNISYVKKEDKNIAKRVNKAPVPKKRRLLPIENAPTAQTPPAPSK